MTRERTSAASDVALVLAVTIVPCIPSDPSFGQKPKLFLASLGPKP